MQKLLLLCLTIFTINVVGQNSGAIFSGIGNPYPAATETSISLDREIIFLAELDSMATWRFVYEFSNASNSPEQVEMITPLTIYFDDFEPGTRAPLLDKLAGLFPDLFDIEGAANKNIAPAIQQKFGNRLFIKRFANQMSLARAGIAYSIQEGGNNRPVSKIGLEFRWIHQPSTPPTLKMTVNFHHNLELGAGAFTTVTARLKTPSSVRNEKPFRYTTIDLGGPQFWAGEIGTVYVVNSLDGTQPLLPRGLTPEQKMAGRNYQVTALKAINPIGLRLALFKEQNPPACYYLPNGLTGLEASSSASESTGDPARQTLARFSTTERVHDLELRGGLSKHYSSWSPFHFEPHQVDAALRSQDVNGMASAAFDLNPGAKKDYKSTSWCEAAEGDGKGSWIGFELLQPAKVMYLENGDQSSEQAYEANGRVRTFRMKSADGTFNKLFPANDIKILDTYYEMLKPGAYTIELNSIFPGNSGKTCIAGISFNFLFGDTWFDENFADL